jgi:Ca2+:H+ antiporter
VRGVGGNIARGVLLGLLLLTPLVLVLDRLDAAGELAVFLLAGAALIPLSWLIGEATDNLARHTGPGIGGFLNATFGNAPELIIAIIALSEGLTEVVRASLVGSIAGNLLLVLGFTLLFGRTGVIDRRSAYISLGLVRFPRRSGPPLARRAITSCCRTASDRPRNRDPLRAPAPAAALRCR